MQVVLPAEGGFVEVPASGALGGVDDHAAVGGDGKAFLRCCGMGDLSGSAVLTGGGEHFAAADESHFLAVSGYRYLVYAGQAEVGSTVEVVVEDADSDFCGLGSGGEGVDLTVVGEAEGTVVGSCQESYGMLGKVGEGGGVLSVVHGCGVDVEGASVTLAEEYHLAGSGEDRVAVLAGIDGDLGMGAVSCIVIEDVAGNGGGVVLAPDILAAGAVVVEEGLPVGVEADGADRVGGYLFGTASRDGDAVEFGEPGTGPQCAGGGVLDGGREVDPLAVRGECQRGLDSRVGGQADGLASLDADCEDVHASEAVGSEGDGPAVRGPDGLGVVVRGGGEPYGLASGGGNIVDVALI